MSIIMPSVLYPVRTQPLYWVVVGALGTLGLASAGLILYMLLGSYMSWTILGLGGLMAVLPIVYVMTTGEYRAQGAIRISRELVEVPDARGHLLQFPVERLELRVTRVRVRVTMIAIPVASVSRGMVLELRADGVRRRISTLTLADPEQGESLLADHLRADIRRALADAQARAGLVERLVVRRRVEDHDRGEVEQAPGADVGGGGRRVACALDVDLPQPQVVSGAGADHRREVIDGIGAGEGGAQRREVADIGDGDLDVVRVQSCDRRVAREHDGAHGLARGAQPPTQLEADLPGRAGHYVDPAVRHHDPRYPLRTGMGPGPCGGAGSPGTSSGTSDDWRSPAGSDWRPTARG